MPNSEQLPYVWAGSIGTKDIADDAVTKAKFAGGVFKMTVIDGGSAGDHTVTGIATGDTLVSVLELALTEGTPNTRTWVASDLTSEFSISADTINNTGGTDTTGAILLVAYEDLT